jgi:hypothetical protein
VAGPYQGRLNELADASSEDEIARKKAPHQGGAFYSSLVRPYRLRPEPGPVGVNVEPLGEPEGASVFPDGFVVALGPVRVPAIPVVEPGGLAIEFPFTEPGVAPVAAEPPTLEPAPEVPALPLLLCASAKVLESASAPANAKVMSFIVVSLVDDQEKTSTGYGCSCAPNTKMSESLLPKRSISRAWEERASSKDSRCDRSRRD